MVTEVHSGVAPSQGAAVAKPEVVPPQAESSVVKPEVQVDVQAKLKELSASVQKINQALKDGGRSLNLSIDNNLGGPIVVVRNAETGEVVRQIPNDAVLSTARNIEMLKGVIYNELT